MSRVTLSYIDKRVAYNPRTGLFTWKDGRRAGREAGSINKPGYRVIELNRKRFLAHRLAWIIVYERWPAGEIDHINGNSLDNRIENLREASRSENGRNVRTHRDNKSGFKGVFPSRHKWAAQICVNGHKQHLGIFETAQEAHAAYQSASLRCHGSFSRVT